MAVVDLLSRATTLDGFSDAFEELPAFGREAAAGEEVVDASGILHRLLVGPVEVLQLVVYLHFQGRPPHAAVGDHSVLRFGPAVYVVQGSAEYPGHVVVYFLLHGLRRDADRAHPLPAEGRVIAVEYGFQRGVRSYPRWVQRIAREVQIVHYGVVHAGPPYYVGIVGHVPVVAVVADNVKLVRGAQAFQGAVDRRRVGFPVVDELA